MHKTILFCGRGYNSSLSGLYSTANDPRPQKIPAGPQMIPRVDSQGGPANDPAKKFGMAWSFSEGENTGR